MRFHENVHDVYFDDLDAFRILHNARYLLIFERTIGAFLRHLGLGGPLDADNNPDQYHLVRTNHMEYQQPVRGLGQVRARVWVRRLGRTSMTFGFRLMKLDEDIDHAEGTRVVVRVDPATLRPVPWSPAFRRSLAPYCEELVEG